jgi:hypothetical protein
MAEAQGRWLAVRPQARSADDIVVAIIGNAKPHKAEAMAKGVLAQRRDKPPMRAFKTWSRRAASDTCSGAGENPPILKMAERGDWALATGGACDRGTGW